MIVVSAIEKVLESSSHPLASENVMDEVAALLSRAGHSVHTDSRRRRLIVSNDDTSADALEVQVKLKNHKAQDCGRYDFWKRVDLMEQWAASRGYNAKGLVLFVTEDHLYWEKGRDTNPIDKDFHLFEGRAVHPGIFEWGTAASPGSKKGREKAVTLRNSYNVEWRSLENRRLDQYRYLLMPVAAAASMLFKRDDNVGEHYRRAVSDGTYSQGEPFIPDVTIIERGLRGHRDTQNGLAEFLRARGIAPLSPRSSEPPFDIAWWMNSRLFVAEIKSITADNECTQMRIGLGQVLHYCQMLKTNYPIVPVLVPEICPLDAHWVPLCERLGGVLCWPQRFEHLVTPTETSLSTEGTTEFCGQRKTTRSSL